jgi:hypothetical protein
MKAGFPEAAELPGGVPPSVSNSIGSGARGCTRVTGHPKQRADRHHGMRRAGLILPAHFTPSDQRKQQIRDATLDKRLSHIGRGAVARDQLAS